MESNLKTQHVVQSAQSVCKSFEQERKKVGNVGQAVQPAARHQEVRIFLIKMAFWLFPKDYVNE